MDYSDFKKNVSGFFAGLKKSLNGNYRVGEILASDETSLPFEYYREVEPIGYSNKLPYDSYLIRYWVTGGERGGGWQDGQNAKPYTVTLEEGDTEFEFLDYVVERYAPQISFMQYRLLMKLIVAGKGIDFEGYGNKVDYGFKVLPMADLYNFLIDRNLLVYDAPKASDEISPGSPPG